MSKKTELEGFRTRGGTFRCHSCGLYKENRLRDTALVHRQQCLLCSGVLAQNRAVYSGRAVCA